MDGDFTGRVRLTSLQASKSFIHPLDENGMPERSRMVAKPSVMVVFHAVKDGDEEDSMFGAATPSGEVKLTIANEYVARKLSEAWQRWIEDEEAPEGYTGYNGYEGQPKYEVTFRRIG